jgi:CRISPR/Cas system-associated exonuclease Cas4 (RecB family)
MYQLGIKWKLWELETVLKAESDLITLRGYNKEAPISLPADFASFNKRLSVVKIGSRYCPTRRDIYFEIRQSKKIRSENRTWGQIAGYLIEDYCKGLVTHFVKTAEHPRWLNYKKVADLAESYTEDFIKRNGKRLDSLNQRATTPEENPARLLFLLQQTAKYELSLLSTDYQFSWWSIKGFVPLLNSIPIKFDQESLTIVPSDYLGIAQKTTPDFIIATSIPVIGEMKTGNALKAFHLTTIAGFALAYESQNKVNVDFGVIYFFETHSKQMNFAQSFVFAIDDILRKQFLLARDQTYSLLQSDDIPELADPKDYDAICKFCKYHADCYPKKQN